MSNILVMGVSGCGKSTIGELLASRLSLEFVDGDDLHPPENVKKMQSNTPLNDDDRKPWLHRIHGLFSSPDIHRVVACSALKRRYRSQLRDGISLTIVYLQGTEELIAKRLAGRSDHFMPHTLLHSQFEALEEPSSDEALIVNIDQTATQVVDTILAHLESKNNSTVVTATTEGKTLGIRQESFGPGFQLQAWMNTTLKPLASHEGENQRNSLLGLTTQLQLRGEDTTHIIAQTADALLAAMPASLEELRIIEHEAKELHIILKDTLEHVTAFDKENNAAIDFLADIDVVKKRVETTSHVIGEIESWKNKCRNIERTFETRNLSKIADEITDLRASLAVVANLPKFDKCHLEVQGYQLRLEAMVLPKLEELLVVDFKSIRSTQTAVLKTEVKTDSDDTNTAAQSSEPDLMVDNDNDDDEKTTTVKDLVEILRLVGREELLQQKYVAARCTLLENVANKYCDPSSRDQASKTCATLIEWLPLFLQDVSLLLKYEAVMLPKCFGHDAATPVYTTLVSSLCNTAGHFLSSWLELLLPTQGVTAILAVVDAWELTRTFALKLHTFLCHAHVPRFIVLRGLLEPFVSYQQNYYVLEKKHLFANLSALTLDGHNYDATCEAVRVSAANMFETARVARERYLTLTGGGGAVTFISCLDAYFTDYIQRLNKLLQNVRRKVGLGDAAYRKDAKEEINSAPTADENVLDSGEGFRSLEGAFELSHVCEGLVTQLAQFERQSLTLILKSLQKLLKGTMTFQESNGDADLESTLLPYVALLTPKTLRELSIFYKKETDNIKSDHFQSTLPACTGTLDMYMTSLYNLIYDLMFAGLEKQLGGMHHWDHVWTANSLSSGNGMALPVFSLQASEHITEAGEYLFTLVQTMEPFVTGRNDSDEEEEESDDDKNDEETRDVTYWLQKIGNGLITLLVKEISLIPRLSIPGAQQLACDLEYLLNIYSALSLSVTQEGLVREMMVLLNLDVTKLSDDELLQQIKTSFSSVSTVSADSATILKTLLKTRQITIPTLSNKSA